MLLSTQTDYLARHYGDEQAIRTLAEVGFDAFDLSLFAMNSNPDYAMNGENFREYAKHLRAVADECGIVCNQSHAPFPTSFGDEEKDEKMFQMVVRAMEAAAIVGAKIIVVHPKQHLDYRTHAAELKEMNMEFYRRLIPYCEKFGIKVATENMWQYNNAAGHIRDSVCSRPYEFADYLNELNSPWIVACLDVGHVVLTNENLANAIRTLGGKHLQALHVHDNDHRDDCHTMPFLGRIDFNELTSTLREIGYQGDFTFEADSFFRSMPEELLTEAYALLHKSGRYLISKI